ncbi:SDR family NAD(P)-dependent oxidoreductase [Falsiroseomonas tokyonensis]|uniref:SDR family NAD(P)-dependent oxidoreductase n=1 Tax=Falsiroseomonas tokyonensis TaxID=430521 RepID=A0ABV7BZU9_9PROT|nr:SDR family NAD(P)-dependent oxidoreductase [Falsiroseomonas tokyonensis]MBU8540167.1 SDR family NAD(P)-dependent oxidoreductase [Falsiroseomonas tokyonensis]
MELHLQGKVALVTGGGQGVGRAICRELAAEGAKVAVNDLFPDRAEAVAQEIRAAGGQAIAAPGDITKPEAVAAFVAKVRESLGQISILVNNAGVTPERRAKGGMPPLFIDTPEREMHQTVELNVFGTMYCCRAVLPDMVALGWGRVISIASEAGRIGEARLAAYSGAKAAIIGLTKALAKEHGRDRITANVVVLGAVSHEGIAPGQATSADATPETNERLAKMLNAYPSAKGLGRLSRPEDVSGVVAFLASDRAAFITGQHIGASGGYAMP